MAKKIGIELDFNTKQAQKSAKEFADEVDVVTGSLEDLEAQQDELLKKLKGVEVGTAEFKELAAELNGIKSEIKDAELAFEGLDMEQRFTAATDALGGVAGGFAAVEGSIALAGVESAEFEETMLRVQGAMALAMGIKDISTAVAALSKLNVAAKLAAAGQRVLNIVMSANPIGLIVTAIGLLVTGLVLFSDKVKSVVMPILEPLIDAFNFVKDAVEAVAERLGLIPSAAERAAKAQADAARNARIKTIEEEKKKLDAIIKKEEETRAARLDSFDFEIEKLRAAGEETFEVEQEKLRYTLESLARQKEALIERFELEKQLAREIAAGDGALSGLITQASKIREDQHKETMDTIVQQEEEASKQLELNQIREDKKRSDAAKKAWEERRRAAEDARKKEEEDRKKAEEERLKREEEERKASEERIKAAEERVKYLDELDRQAEIDRANQQVELAQKTAERLEEIRQAELEKERAIAEAKESLQDSIAQGALALTELLVRDQAKAERIQKAVALAQIAIDTAKAISSLTANSEANPANAVTGGLAGIAQFAAGIARILTNMASAAALLKRPSPNVSNLSSSAGGGVAGAGVPINAVQNGSTLIGNNEPQREFSKVVVVESDITSTQQGISQIQSQATVVE